jgi:hypothetical protein
LGKINYTKKDMETDLDKIFGANGEYRENENLKVVHIPETYTAIAKLAFDSSCIEELSIPSSVTEIGDGAFLCAKIKRLMLPDWKYWCEVDMSGGEPTEEVECDGELALVNIGWTVPMGLSEHVFVGGEEISTSIEIPDTVKELKPGVLCGLSKVEYIHLPNTISTIGEGALSDCESLKEINIPESVTTIGVRAFFGCESLTKVVIPGTVRCISRWAFSQCHGLTTVVLTSGHTKIGYGAFYACNNLRTVISLNPCPPDCKDAFDYGKELTLYVPAGSVEAYANAEGWNKFKEIKEIDPNETLNYC